MRRNSSHNCFRTQLGAAVLLTRPFCIRHGDRPVEESINAHPSNAQPRRDVECVGSFADCECKPGLSELRSNLCIEQGPALYLLRILAHALSAAVRLGVETEPILLMIIRASLDVFAAETNQRYCYTCPTNVHSLQGRR